MKLKEKLILEEVAIKMIKTWDEIQDSYKGWALEKQLATWRIEVYSCILYDLTNKEELDFILTYLYENGPAKVYLEVNDLVTQHHIENNKINISLRNYIINRFSSIINNIGKLFKGDKGNAKEVRTNSEVCIR